MARHKLTPEEQLKGIEKAMSNPKTPQQLKKGLERRKAELEKQKREAA